MIYKKGLTDNAAMKRPIERRLLVRSLMMMRLKLLFPCICLRYSLHLVVGNKSETYHGSCVFYSQATSAITFSRMWFAARFARKSRSNVGKRELLYLFHLYFMYRAGFESMLCGARVLVESPRPFL